MLMTRQPSEHPAMERAWAASAAQAIMKGERKAIMKKPAGRRVSVFAPRLPPVRHRSTRDVAGILERLNRVREVAE
jgi:hypothetical protein